MSKINRLTQLRIVKLVNEQMSQVNAIAQTANHAPHVKRQNVAYWLRIAKLGTEKNPCEAECPGQAKRCNVKIRNRLWDIMQIIAVRPVQRAKHAQ